MNTYSQILYPVKDEIDEFAGTDEGRKWDSSWYEGLKVQVARAITAPTDASAEQILDTIGWIVVDSGPLGKGFAPAIDKALDAMQRNRKRRFKEERQAKQGKSGEPDKPRR